MPRLASAWTFQIERGPSCLYVQPTACSDSDTTGSSGSVESLADGFAEQVWQAMMQHLTFRLVLEMHDVPEITPELRHELCQLRDRIENHSGLMKLVGLTSEARQQLSEAPGSVNTVAHFESRNQAVMSGRASRPK